jgi:glycosyltransferase involved in cell wall biosynthesis
MGAASSRNRGVRASSSELIAFLDSDDFWADTKLEEQHARFVARPKVDLVYCDQYIVTADQRRLPSGKKLISEDILGHLLQSWTAPNTSTLMLRRSSFERLGGFDEALPSCQDHDLWMRVAQQGLVVDCVREPLSFFCFDHDDRISANYRDRMAGVEAFLQKWRDLIVERAGPEQFRRFRNRYYVTAAFSVFTSLLRSGRAEALIVFWKYLAANPAFYGKSLERMLALMASAKT